MKYMHLELKVCEGCGMLWLRRKQQTDGNYCAGCAARLAGFPIRGKHAGGRPRHEGPRPRTRRSRNMGCAAAKAGAR